MQIIDVYPKDIHITIDLTATEVDGLIGSLGVARIEYDGKKDPAMARHVLLLDAFYKLLVEARDGLPKRTAG